MKAVLIATTTTAGFIATMMYLSQWRNLGLWDWANIIVQAIIGFAVIVGVYSYIAESDRKRELSERTKNQTNVPRGNNENNQN